MLVTLSGCALQAPPTPKEYGTQALPGVQVPGQWTAGEAQAGAYAGRWLATFAEPRLDALVAEPMQHNPDLLVAAARVQVASEYADLADSTLYPQVNLLARGGGQLGGDSSGLQGAGLFADWELDLWGRVRSARAANQAGYESVVADTEYARQSVAALVAKSYFLAVEAGLQLGIAHQMVAGAVQLAALAGQQLQFGVEESHVERRVLTDEGKATLDEVAANLTRLKFVSGTVVGHTDSSGSEAYNQSLSERRAQAVADYLGARASAAGVWPLPAPARASLSPTTPPSKAAPRVAAWC